MADLEIINLHVRTEEREILHGVSLEVNKGETHALMGPNGSGKSTLSNVIMGHPAYEVTQGEIHFKGQNVIELDPEERARLGLFMAFQYPVEIPGISNRPAVAALPLPVCAGLCRGRFQCRTNCL